MEETEMEHGNKPTEVILDHWKDSVRKAVEYIDSHLESSLAVEEIAKAAGMSKTHFCRVFRWLVKEKVGEYARRRRLERAASALRLTQYPVTQIALEYGFDSPSAFTRSFRNHFSSTPSRFRRQNQILPSLNAPQLSLPAHPTIDVSVVNNPQQHMTYITVVGGGYLPLLNAISKLIRFGKSCNQIERTALIAIRSFDDELITPDDKARYDVGLVTNQPLPDKVAMENGFIPAGQYARSLFKGTIEEHSAAWNQLAYDWTFHSGYDFGEMAGYDFIRVQTDLAPNVIASFKAMATNKWRYETEMLMPVQPGRVSILGRSQGK